MSGEDRSAAPATATHISRNELDSVLTNHFVRSGSVRPAGICFLEQATGAFEITWSLFKCLGIPFGSLNREEVTTVDV